MEIYNVIVFMKLSYHLDVIILTLIFFDTKSSCTGKLAEFCM